MTDRFAPDVLGRFRDEEEVRIETSRGPDAPTHRTIIWIVVDDRDRVLVRSVLRQGRQHAPCVEARLVGSEIHTT